MRTSLVSRNGRHLPLVVVLVCALLATGAVRANIVQNPGFETGDFIGWTVSGNGIAIDMVFPNTGCCDAVFTAFSTDPNAGVLSQTLTTTPGQDYRLSFALLDEAGFSDDAFIVDLGGFSATITGDMAAPPGDLPSFYTAFSIAVPGSDITGTGTTLSFQGLNDPVFDLDWNLDDVSVSAAIATGLCLVRARRTP